MRKAIIAALVAAGLIAAAPAGAATHCTGSLGDPTVSCSGGGPNTDSPINTGGSGGRIVLSDPDTEVGGYDTQVSSGGGGYRGLGDGSLPGDPIFHGGSGGRCTIIGGASTCVGRFA